jgi:hypothetical protein
MAGQDPAEEDDLELAGHDSSENGLSTSTSGADDTVCRACGPMPRCAPAPPTAPPALRRPRAASGYRQSG